MYRGNLYGVLLCMSAVMLPIPMGFGFGKLIGGLADFLHGSDVLAHVPHLLVKRVFVGSKAISFGPPLFRGNGFAGCFQIIQIPHGRESPKRDSPSLC